VKKTPEDRYRKWLAKYDPQVVGEKDQAEPGVKRDVETTHARRRGAHTAWRHQADASSTPYPNTTVFYRML